MLDLEQVRSLLVAATSQAVAAKNEKLVLVVGNTGAGKSTAVNYLLGRGMKRGLRGKVEPLLPDQPAATGDGSESVTIFPGIYKDAEGSVLCDCPGFLDTRTKEENICGAIATEMAIKVSEKIEAILIVVDYFSIDVDRGEGLKKVSDVIARLLHNPQAVLPSILFLVNKVPSDLTHEDIVAKIDDLISANEKKFDELSRIIDTLNTEVEAGFYDETHIQSRIEEAETIFRILRVLKLMRADAVFNLKLINIFDEGQSRREINKFLKNVKAIDKEHFNFEDYNDLRKPFLQAMENIAEEAVNLFNQKAQLPEEIANHKKDIEQMEGRIIVYGDQIKQLYENAAEQIQNPVLIRNLELQGVQLDENLRSTETRVTKLEKGINQKRQELDALDVSIPALHWEDKLEESGHAGIMHGVQFGLTVAGYAAGLPSFLNPGKAFRGVKSLANHANDGYTFFYSGIPFTHVERECAAGAFISENSAPSSGRYSVTYKPQDRFGKQSATVRIFAETKKIPKNASRITQLRQQLLVDEANKNRIEADICKLKNEIAFTKKVLIETQNKDLGNPAEGIKECDVLIDGLRNRISELNTIVDSIENELSKVEISITRNITLFESAMHVLVLLNEPLVGLEKEFLEIMMQRSNIVKSPKLAKTLFFSKGNEVEKQNSKADDFLGLDAIEVKIKFLQTQIGELQQQLSDAQEKYVSMKKESLSMS